ncbi:ferrous iron transport protein B [Anaerotruncus rubiinfantis]|uniref:ferrous iron transport protein B n=1 Tax=Anaerotruncus rubiinfantis TaxID=1720200 RepID=UPI0008332877|nr:ferrous iron transport protein B [Anaerotruncus rubiinfantis]
MKKIALAGNPNCGKTTLFNILTGSRQHVGNWAGVTVERKEGELRAENGRAVLVDLPGIYSLTTYTLEERVSRRFLLSDEPDAVVSLLDGTSIARGLYLTLQLCETGCPVVLAIGMMDEVRAAGGKIDTEILEKRLDVPVVPVTARTGENVSVLAETALALPKASGACVRYHGKLEGAIDEVIGIVAGPDTDWRRVRFDAIGLLEGEAEPAGRMGLDRGQLLRIARVREQLETACGGADILTVVADARYRVIDALVREAVRLPAPDEDSLTAKIDRIALHKFCSYPIFFAVLAGMFAASFGGVGLSLKALLEHFFAWASGFLQHWLPAFGVGAPLTGLVTGGVLGGVGSVLTFLPQIAILFLCLTLLEECGYLARAAFLMDLPLRRLGLTGKSFIPMVMGFGCTTPAVMAARTLENEHDRRLTIFLTPFLSCGARFPIYALLAGVFFPAHPGAAVTLLYLLGMLVAGIYGYFLRKGPMRGALSPFLMEFPPYRIPSLQNVLRNTAEKCGDFLRKAGTLIFLLSVLIWLFQHFDPRLQFVPDGTGSLFERAGQLLAPLFAPLGFRSGEAAISLLAGLISKEAVVSTLGVVCGAAGDPAALAAGLRGLFTPLSAAAFLAFCALYTPCISALATMRRELHSTKAMLAAAAAQLLIAYGVAMAVYQFGTLFQNLLRLFG